MSTPSDPVDPSETCPAEAVLVRTSETDPVASLRAASVDPSRGRLLAAVATVPRERLERQLSDAGYSPGDSRIVEFERPGDGRRRAIDDEGGERQVHGDLSGLSMELVGQFDWLAEGGNGIVYLDSLEPLVSAAGLESTFRFLVIIAARARANGVTLVARLEPGALDPVPTGTLTEAFDRTVDQYSVDEEEEEGERPG